jgi:hypothetical protein
MKVLACALGALLIFRAGSLPSSAQNEFGIATYLNATEMPEATANLLEMKGSTWLAARAYRTDDPIKNVVKHFRELAARAKKPSLGNQLVQRLVQNNWQIDDRTVSSANVIFGVSKDLKGIAKEKVKSSFGAILLDDDSYVRVHLITPYPIPPQGMNMADGTMIVMIRERMSDPAATVANEGVDEEVYTGKEVTQKVRLRSKPPPNFPAGLSGTVVLKAVFASSGKITKIVVLQDVPGMTEEAIKAARKITFDPAIKDGRYVAQWIQLEYHLN